MTSINKIFRAFMRFFFKHLYTTIAWAYDVVAFASSMGQWSNWQKAGTDRLPQGRILEIGFGTGRVLQRLSSEKREIYGIDSSHQMTRITARRLRADHLPKNLCQAVAQDLPFPAESFQSLIATFPSEYIFHEDTFKEAWRILKEDGVFIIIPGVSQILGWKARKSLIGLLDEGASILCRLTGEALCAGEEWKKIFQNGLQEFGFKVDIELVQQKRAVILRIIARKQTSPG